MHLKLLKKNPWFILFTLLIFFSSCGKSAFLSEMQGKWKVTEINYITENGTITDFPSNMFFIFYGNTYQTLSGDTISESGSYDVNFKVTQITFYSTMGISTVLIEEKSDVYQHWRSKNKIIDFYLDFKLDKIE